MVSFLLFVGTTGFEPATPRPPVVCATGLRHVPILTSLVQHSQKIPEISYPHRCFVRQARLRLFIEALA